MIRYQSEIAYEPIPFVFLGSPLALLCQFPSAKIWLFLSFPTSLLLPRSNFSFFFFFPQDNPVFVIWNKWFVTTPLWGRVTEVPLNSPLGVNRVKQQQMTSVCTREVYLLQTCQPAPGAQQIILSVMSWHVWDNHGIRPSQSALGGQVLPGPPDLLPWPGAPPGGWGKGCGCVSLTSAKPLTPSPMASPGEAAAHN